MYQIETPILSIVGKSNSGKTTLIEKLLQIFVQRGLKIATIKHDAHSFDVDHPGKDTWRHREAGASTVLIASSERVFLTKKIDEALTLDQLRSDFLEAEYDLILTEGFRRDNAPKIEVHRTERSKDLVYEPGEENVIAVASDTSWDFTIPVYHLDDAKSIADFIVERFSLA